MATPDELLAKAALQRQACLEMLASVGCSKEECDRYKNRLMHRLLLTGWYIGKEVGIEAIKDHVDSIRAIENDPRTHQMKAIQAREPPPVVNEGGGGIQWEPDRGGRR